MLDKLTPEQEALFPIIVKKWIEWGTRETDTDIATIQRNMEWLYEQAGIEKVPCVVCDTQQDFIDEITLFVKNMGASVRASVWDSVGASVWASVWASVGASVGASVRASVRDSVWASVGAYYWADDLSFFDYFKEIGVITDAEFIEKVEKNKDALSDVSSGFITDKICIVLRKPKVRLNTQGFLHSDEFPSVQWKDGKHNQYYLNDVKFEKEMWEKIVSRNMPFMDILAIGNVDQRTQAMRYSNVSDFLKHAKAKKLDTFQKSTSNGAVVDYALYQIPAREDLFTEDAYYAVYNCPSTGKVYMSGVPKSNNIKESMAWKSGMTVAQWKLMVPLIHES